MCVGPSRVRGVRLAATLVVATIALGCTEERVSGDGSAGSIDAVPGAGEPIPDSSDAGAATTAEPHGAEHVRVAWAQVLTGPSAEDEIDGVAAAPDGGAWITGKFEDRTTFAGTTLRSAGAADAPLARLNADGTTRWLASVGGTGEDNYFDVDADEHGAVATGWFEGTVDFGGVELTSAGSRDCVVLAYDDDGGVRWARSLGGPGLDGCNEVTLAPDGSVVTSLDTAGGWNSPAGPVPATSERDTILLSLDADGEVRWGRRVGGVGSQQGRAIAIAPDGRIAFGGSTDGELVAGRTAFGRHGGGTDGWLTEWSRGGELRWATTWGAGGDEVAKGAAYGEHALFVVGAFGDTVELGSITLDAGEEADMAVARFDEEGDVVWATSISGAEQVVGAEAVTSANGGVLFAVNGLGGGLEVRPASGEPIRTSDGVLLVEYLPDGSVGLAATLAGTGTAVESVPGEIARVDERVYLDIVIRGDRNSAAGQPLVADRKDGSLWALDVRAAA